MVIISLLIVNILGCFIFKQKKNIIPLVLITLSVAYFDQIVDIYGILSLAVLYCLSAFALNAKHDNPIYSTVAWCIFVPLLLGFMIHIIPGFKNPIWIQDIEISTLSRKFSLYIQFDKIIAGIIVLMNCQYIIDNACKLNLRVSLVALTLCSSLLMALGIITNFIKVDINIPSILLEWVISNLFFVSLIEEVICRGIIQDKIKSVIPNHASLSIIFASVIFGCAHYRGGAVYVALSTVAGLFYGYTYDRTRSIINPVIVHFGLNLIHLLFFTYPSVVKL